MCKQAGRSDEKSWLGRLGALLGWPIPHWADPRSWRLPVAGGTKAPVAADEPSAAVIVLHVVA